MRVTAPRLMGPGTAALSDAMHKGGAMHREMQCRSAKAAMAGPAFTVRVHAADILMIGPALKECPKGHVLVIDGHGDLGTALWGELAGDRRLLEALQTAFARVRTGRRYLLLGLTT